jgi:glutathione S-transferase
MLIVHHLKFSRSTRVIWLLEELGEPYRLISYDRDPQTMRAPAALAAVHPLGKAPVIQDGDLTLAESGAIISYVLATYGRGRLAPPPGTPDWACHEEWLHYAEGSLVMPVLLPLLGGMMGGLPEALQRFVQPEIRKHLDYVGGRLQGRDHVMGAAFTAADIQLHYVLGIARTGGLLADRPAITAYLDRLEARPAFRKAIEVGGPLSLPRG